MRKKTIEDIKQHALEAYPKEACGLIVKDGRKELYIPLENTSENPEEHFRICPEAYAEVEEKYQVMAIFHSHPEATSKPSEADRVLCEGTQLPWVIVGLYKDNVTGEMVVLDPFQFVPEGYEAPLEGRIFHHGVLDCYSLIRDYYRQKLGIEIMDFERKDNWWEDPNASSMYEDHFEEAGFVKVTDGSLKEHDVIIMEICSSAGPNHAAVYLGDNLMLHHMAAQPSTKAVYGGSWQYATRFVVRYKDFIDE
ncbi:C40 family peptidase [Oligella urethralis]|uniref:NlpC/P60 family n=1 Tax=Oligella urethralis TaxID=90245 RepID=A0A2X1VHR8_9BURK|nr:C40 family peptidase [Oligella urethralis]SPY08020.1 NlpC/P60 family [Oligella urethralis]